MRTQDPPDPGATRPAAPTDGPADVSADWWAYVRRVGDDIAVKDFDVTVTPEALRALIAEELTDDRLDDLVQHMGRAFKPEITRRSGFTSELFPMLPDMTLSVIDDFHTYVERIAVIDVAMPAEEIGRRLRVEPGLVSPLWIWMIGTTTTSAAGRPHSDGQAEARRAARGGAHGRRLLRRLTPAHRGDGTLDYKDAGFTNRYLPPEVVDGLVASGQQLDPASSSSKALKRINATVSGYAFLDLCDSRVGICYSGPYPRPDGRRTIVRDYLSLGPSPWGYPWAERLDPPFAGLTMALTFDPAAFHYFEINDWGTTFTEPDQLFTRGYGGRRRRAPHGREHRGTRPRTGGRKSPPRSAATTWPSTSSSPTWAAKSGSGRRRRCTPRVCVPSPRSRPCSTGSTGRSRRTPRLSTPTR